MAKPKKKKTSAKKSKAKKPRARKANPANPAPKKRSKKRSAKKNPAPKKRRSRRASRRNPGGPIVMALMAGAAGLAAFVAGQVANQVVNPGFDPMIRRGVAAAGVVGGLALATKHPLYGAGIAAGSAVMLAGSEVTLAAFKVLPQKTTTAAVVMGSPRMLSAGDESMGAVQIGAVRLMTPGEETMGALVAPGAPWETASPV